MNFIEAMRASHTEQHKLAVIINKMRQNDYGMALGRFTNDFEKIKELYVPNIHPITPYYGKMSYVWEEKFDGYSYLGDNDRLFSRSLSEARGNEGQPVEKTDRVPHISKQLRILADILGGLNVHGELYIPGGTSDDVTTIMGCDADKAIARQLAGKKLQYLIYDVRSIGGIGTIKEPWYIRRCILEHIDLTIRRNDLQDIEVSYIGRIPAEQGFKNIIQYGGEGIMIKNTRGLYVPGKKPADNWVKCKKEYTADVVIMGLKPGTGKNADMFGSILYGMYVNGKLTQIGAASGITDDFRRQVADNPDTFIGRVMEIKAMEPNKKKVSFRSARFKRLRDDKLPTECIMDNIRPAEELL